MSARVVATHVWPSDIDEPVSVDVLELDWGGPVGDRHHGERMASDTRQSTVFTRGTSIRNHRQVSIVDTGELAQIATAMGIPRIDPGVIADNICTEGIDALTALPRMTRLVFASGAVIMLGGPNAPCTIAGGMLERVYGSRPESFPKAAWGLRGVTGWIEHPGTVRPGDAVTVHEPD
jgi:hypothetical protein